MTAPATRPVTAVAASAPGKLLLFGEYAVLAGGTAVVMAVDRRARVRIDPVDSEDLHVVAPQLGLTGDGLLFDADAPERVLGLSGRLLGLRLAARGIDPVGLRIEIDTGELFDQEASGQAVKLGLGSSAAVSAALDTALAAHAGQPHPELDELLAAYRAAVGGPVSGADLAASLRGGLQRVAPAGEGLLCSVVEWPEGLHACAVWAGRPASTPEYARAFADWRSRDPDAAERWTARANALTRQALELGSAAVWTAAARRWLDALIELQAALGLEIVTEPHRVLADAAAEHGVAYKTCGAGGGDFGIALSDDPQALASFRAAASALDRRPVELKLDLAGARVDAAASSQGA